MSETLMVDKNYIDQKSDGWIKKVEQLYAHVRQVLKNDADVHFQAEQYVLMQEEPMQEYGVPAKKVPIFDLFVGSQLKATFKPVGLWVVGAKGRVDILTKEGAYTLVDLSEDDTLPNWQVFTPQNRRRGSTFDAAFISTLIR